MTRRLILMRHAKSDWGAGVATDHARPLNDRGRHDAPRMARRIDELGWRPDRVVSSDATRTRQTLELMEAAWGPPSPQVRLLATLYLAGIDALRSALASVPMDDACVLALGHNPGWEDAVLWLCGEDTELPTATAVLLEHPAPAWPPALDARGQWKRRNVLRPKELDEE